MLMCPVWYQLFVVIARSAYVTLKDGCLVQIPLPDWCAPMEIVRFTPDEWISVLDYYTSVVHALFFWHELLSACEQHVLPTS